MLGITDEPIKSFEQDTLNLEHYVAALLEFIKPKDIICMLNFSNGISFLSSVIAAEYLFLIIMVD